MPECSIVVKSWGELSTDELYAFLKLRTDVFFVEQKVDDTELDGRDRDASTRHFWIADDLGTAAYLRVIVDDEPEHLDARHLIGRVVVRADRRGDGLARALMTAALERYGHEPMLMHAQSYIAPLYASFGFDAFGDGYDEAGLPHVSMYRAGAAVPTPAAAS